MNIEIDNITKSYGNRIILNDISLKLEQGTCTGIMGSNGCGKTTLLSIIAGVMKCKGMRVTNGITIGLVPQTNPLIEGLSVYDNMLLWSNDKRIIERTLQEYDFSDIRKRKVKKLSGGMKRRLSVTCAMMGEPDLLIMDEPTSALDMEYKNLIHKSMSEYVKRGGILLIATHSTEEAAICDHLYRLQDGYLREITIEDCNR
ncbi:MAG: ABC transporter ATP-binding protein [Lachnospiraceae bacterium]|nr:ABC transporter ATP-binding protein [Lachnospiraceae bacterium]